MGPDIIFNKIQLMSMVLRQMAFVKNIPFKVHFEHTKDNTVCPALLPPGKSYLRGLRIKSLLLTIFWATLIFQVSHGKSLVTNEKLNTNEEMLGWATVLMLTILMTHVHQARMKGPELLSFLNKVLQFTTKHSTQSVVVAKSPKDLPLLEFFNMAFVPTALANGFLFPLVFAVGFHWQNPCRVSLVGYSLLPECHNITGRGDSDVFSIAAMGFQGILKGGLLTMNFSAWFFAIHGTIFLVTSVEILSMFLIRDGILMFWHKLNLTRKYKEATIYRQIQLLGLYCNNAQKYALGSLVVASTFILSCSFALLVRIASSEDRNLTMMMVLLTAIFDTGVALLVVLGGIVEVHMQSKQIMHRTKWLDVHCGSGTRHYHESKWRKRFWKSCTLVKINFGGQNFIEELTPLVCTDYAFQTAVQLLLVN